MVLADHQTIKREVDNKTIYELVSINFNKKMFVLGGKWRPLGELTHK